MNEDIDAALQELFHCQCELEDLRDLINDPEFLQGLTPILRRCFTFRMSFFERNIEILEKFIEAELDKVPFNYNLIVN